MKKLVLTSVVLGILGSPVCAFAGTATGGATLPEQIVQEVTAVQQKAEEVSQLEQQIQMYENMVTNTAEIPNQLWQQMTQPLSQLAQVVSQGQALALNAQNIGQQFQQMYAGFQPGASLSDYQNWVQSNNDQIQGALATQNLSVADFQNQAQSLQTIEGESPSGRAGLLNVANQIAAVEAGSLQQLGTMTAAQEHAQDNYMAFQIKHDQGKDGSNQTWAQQTANPNNVPSNLY
jgi:P-type conjugative transfer protein TrbJ